MTKKIFTYTCDEKIQRIVLVKCQQTNKSLSERIQELIEKISETPLAKL